MATPLLGSRVPLAFAQRRSAHVTAHRRGVSSIRPSIRFQSSAIPNLRRISRRGIEARAQEDRPVVYNKEFGYSRKDVLLIGVGLIAIGYGLYYGLQATGMEPGMAGGSRHAINEGLPSVLSPENRT